MQVITSVFIVVLLLVFDIVYASRNLRWLFKQHTLHGCLERYMDNVKIRFYTAKEEDLPMDLLMITEAEKQDNDPYVNVYLRNTRAPLKFNDEQFYQWERVAFESVLTDVVKKADFVHNTSTDDLRALRSANKDSNSITIAEDRRTNLITGALLDTLTQNHSDEHIKTVLRIACEGGPTIADVYRILYPSAAAGDALQMFRENPSRQLERIAFEYAIQRKTLPQVYYEVPKEKNSLFRCRDN